MPELAPAGLIDSHCHLDSPRFDADRDLLLARARERGLRQALICAGEPEDFGRARETARRYGLRYAVGIHPLSPALRPEALDGALSALREFLSRYRDDPALAAVGEIGLDGTADPSGREERRRAFEAQLGLAREFGLPVSVHSRGAVEEVLLTLRRSGVRGGALHAFNGSPEQARRAFAAGFCVGFGGALAYPSSRRIRRLLAELPDGAPILETDAPDIPPPWRRGQPDSRSRLEDIAAYGREAAALRGISEAALAALTGANALAAFPRLADPAG